MLALGGNAQCSYCKETLEAESILSHEKKCMNKPVKCPECCDVIALKNWFEHECQPSKSKGILLILLKMV